MNTHTICIQCSGPIVRGEWDTPANPNICPACEAMQPLINQVLGPISEQGKLYDEIMDLNIQIAVAKQKVALTEQLNAIEVARLRQLLAQKEVKEKRVLSV